MRPRTGESQGSNLDAPYGKMTADEAVYTKETM